MLGTFLPQLSAIFDNVCVGGGGGVCVGCVCGVCVWGVCVWGGDA